LWPKDKAARAVCRSVANEMHAGFAALRTHMPMDIRNSYPGRGRAPGVQADIERTIDIWQDCRRKYGQSGPFLFGSFTIADAMFAPVVARFMTYAVDLPEIADTYARALWGCPEMVEWRQVAVAETAVIP
jgi:glutathione S-transferase